MAIKRLKRLIGAAYPDAHFDVVMGEEPEGVYLIATLDVSDTDEVVDRYVDVLLELQVDDELSLYVVPVRPLERVLTDFQSSPPRATSLAD